ncbi:PREDICTED: luciferin 4-monooxygenase-like isoform X2 [Vollenhovia emeryi]|uniref:luciferin 4-monooxygenase-like isoform X2 n=1 Tax=Vollenhovia emeryi TaxID=411798 RepID=UPI0005F4C2E1|nr:PREDICTED: luciferin 4-monooxygenase-like isoform X2 [Vollenhovia emeryi]
MSKGKKQCFCDVKVETAKHLIGEKKAISNRNIGDSILNALKARPNQIGQVNADTGHQCTFQEMRENSVKCALWLKRVGVKKGDVITICTRNPSFVYVPFLASIYIGAITNPWEETYFRDVIRVMSFVALNKPDVIFVDDDNFVTLILVLTILKDIKKVPKIVTINEIKCALKLNSLEAILDDDLDKAEIDNFTCEKVSMTDTAIRAFFSSAHSYNTPMNVPYIAFVSPSNKQTPIMSPGDVGLWSDSLCWTHGSLLTVHAILSHVTAIKFATFSVDNFYKIIREYKVTWTFLENNMFENLCRDKTSSPSKEDLSSLKILLFDTPIIMTYMFDYCTQLFDEKPDISIIQVYSKPETGVIFYQPFLYDIIGYVTKNVQVLFMTEDREFRTADRIFKVLVKTPYMPPCPICHNARKRWYYTESYGYYGESDQIFIYNTHKTHIYYEDKVIWAEIIEGYLKVHPEISEVIITSVRDYFGGKHPVAYVKLKPGAQITEMEMLRLMSNYFEDHRFKFYGGVQFIDEFPRLPNGKIYRQHLRVRDPRSTESITFGIICT